MLKKASFRKITMATCALLIVFILYIFPTTEQKSYPTEQNYISPENKKCDIYLIDDNSYVALTSIPTNKEDPITKAKEIISTLTIDSKNNEYIPNGFKSIIPKKTIINDISLKDGLLKIDFSKELNNIDEKNEEKMIEAIVYSLTSIKDINKVMIFVDGEILHQLPHSKKSLPNILDRSYGINKVYDLDDYKDTTKTTIYYISKFKDNYYYVPVTKVNNDQTNKVEIIVNELKSNPVYETNLMSYLKANAELLDYELKENTISLSFNQNILSNLDSRSISEEVKYTIALSLKDTLNVEEVLFLVDDEKVDSMVFNQLK